MDEVLYEDDNCTYCWGDPRVEKSFVGGKLVLMADSIKFESPEGSTYWPKASIKSISYAPTHPVDLDEITRGQGIDAAQDIAIALSMDRVPDPTLSLNVQDPEGVNKDGFDILGDIQKRISC